MFVMNEYYKEKIGFYKLLLTLLATAFYGTFGWYFVNYKTILLKEAIVSVFGMFFIFSFILASVVKIRFYTDKMRKD